MAKRAVAIATNADDTNRTGHVMRGYLAAVQFLRQYPKVREWLSSQPRSVSRPVDIRDAQFERSWQAFLKKKRNRAQHAILTRILPESLGGETRGGGGGAFPFKVALRLAADYLNDPRSAPDDPRRDPRYKMVRRREFDRDYPALNALKRKYAYRCQICGTTIDLGGGRFYCEAHHLRPLGGDHRGDADSSNVIILCPTHHAEFDHFLFAILDHSGTRRSIEHMYRKLGSDERRILVKHRIARENLDYVIEQFLTRLELYFN